MQVQRDPEPVLPADGHRVPASRVRAPGGVPGHAPESPMDGVLQDGGQHEGAELGHADPEQVQHQEGGDQGGAGGRDGDVTCSTKRRRS